MKRMVQLILLLISISSLFANNLSEEETRYAINCVKDAVFVASNYFISEIKPKNPNLILRIPKNSDFSDAMVFDNCDMSFLLPYFPNSELNSSNMIENLKQPIAPYVREILIEHNWKAGEAIIIGALAIAFKDDLTIAQVVSNLVQDIYPRMGLVTDITIEGSLFSEKVNVKGVFILEENYGTLEINPLQISINGEEFDIYSL